MRANTDEKYEGITTFKIGEVASRASVNKETMPSGSKRFGKLLLKYSSYIHVVHTY